MGTSVNDFKLHELVRLIAGWPGLVSSPDEGLVGELVEDSLVVLQHLGDGLKVVDVGSGAGLPGLAIKIRRPELEVTLIEADGRKAAFLTHACARLDLSGVEVVNMRAEDAGHDPRFREAFDVAVARALAPMPVVAELCLPLVRVGGRLLAQKTSAEDVAGAGRAIETMGGGAAVVEAAPSRARSAGTVVVVEKVRPTPAEYPRRPGLPAKKPL
jgi:16S rRNA (guanine527-N7)-methyltransferase